MCIRWCTRPQRVSSEATGLWDGYCCHCCKAGTVWYVWYPLSILDRCYYIINTFRDVGMAKSYLPNVARVPDLGVTYGLNLFCWYFGALFFSPQKNNGSNFQLKCESEDNTFVRCNTVMCYCDLFKKLTSAFHQNIVKVVVDSRDDSESNCQKQDRHMKTWRQFCQFLRSCSTGRHRVAYKSMRHEFIDNKISQWARENFCSYCKICYR